MVSNVISLSAKSNTEAELKIYKSLCVPQFRDLLLKIEGFRHRKNGELNHNYHLETVSWESVQVYVAYLTYNSLIHIIALSITLVCFAVTILYFSNWYAAYAILACLFLFNIWCILLQRYNFLRIKILQLKVEGRQQAKKMEAANKVVQHFPENYCIEKAQNDWQLIKRMLNSLSNKKDIAICKNDSENLVRLSLLIKPANSLQKTKSIITCTGIDYVNEPVSNLLNANIFRISPYNKVDWRVDRLLRYTGKEPLLPNAAIITMDEEAEKAYRTLSDCSSSWSIVEALEILDFAFSIKFSKL